MSVTAVRKSKLFTLIKVSLVRKTYYCITQNGIGESDSKRYVKINTELLKFNQAENTDLDEAEKKMVFLILKYN